MASYAIQVEERAGYLRADVTGDWSGHDDAIKAWLGLAREMRERGQRNVLVVRRDGVLGDERTMSAILLALEDLGFGGTRGAFVLRGAPPPQFLEAIARQRGLDLRVCADVEAAERFLVGAEPG